MNHLFAFLHSSRQIWKALGNLSYFAGQKYPLLANLFFFSPASEHWEHSVTSLGRTSISLYSNTKRWGCGIKKEQDFRKPKLQLRRESSKGRERRWLVAVTRQNRFLMEKGKLWLLMATGGISLQAVFSPPQSFQRSYYHYYFSNVFQVFILDQKWNDFGKSEEKRQAGSLEGIFRRDP